MGAYQSGPLMSNYQSAYSIDTIKLCIEMLCTNYLFVVAFLPEKLTLNSCDVDCVFHQIDKRCHTGNYFEILLTIEEEKKLTYSMVSVIWSGTHFIEVDKADGTYIYGSKYKSLRDYPVIVKTLEELCDTTVIHGSPDLIN